MKSRHRSIWLVLCAFAAFGVFWSLEGAARVRRMLYPVVSAPENERTAQQFIALAFPRIAKEESRFAIERSKFDAILTTLRQRGYTSIALKEIADFYGFRRPLPKKAIFIALQRDNPASIHMADKALKKNRMRAAVFMIRPKDVFEARHVLNAHAIKQLDKSGAWEFGRASDDGTFFRADRSGAIALRFLPAKTGFNDAATRTDRLRIFLVRGDRTADEVVQFVEESWTRRSEFLDTFSSAKLNPEWIVSWGVASGARHHLAIVPTMRQRSAAVFINGTEGWRDSALEFEVSKTHKNFWAYSRFVDEKHFVRVALQNGFWTVEQKTGPREKPNTLARSPLAEPLPVRVRLVVKRDWAILHINGQMQFGKPLRLNPSVDRGRVQFGIFDDQSRDALGVLSYVRARPLEQRWLELDPAALSDEKLLERVREEAVYSYFMAPRWFELKDGKLTEKVKEEELTRTIAGFYRCELAPVLRVRDDGWAADKGAAMKAADALIEQVERLDASGLAARLDDGVDWRTLARFLSRLHEGLRSRHKSLWLVSSSDEDLPMIDGRLQPMATDGLLRILEPAKGKAAAS